MAIYVMVRLRVREDRLRMVEDLIRCELGPAEEQRIVRSRSRVFHLLGARTELLRLCEWTSREAAETYLQTPAFRAVADLAEAPPTVRCVERVAMYERSLERAHGLVCSLVTVDRAACLSTVEQYLVDVVHREMIAAPGLVSHETYRSTDEPALFVGVHRWRDPSDAERFGTASHHQELAELGASVDLYTAALVAEYPPS